jgi:adenylate cyclase
MSVLGEFKRRKIIQVTAVYLLIAWLTMQVVDVINDPLNLPDWFDTVVIVLLALGLPIALILSWAFNLTPDGVARDTGDQPAQSGGRTIEYVLIGLLAIAVAWVLYRVETRPPDDDTVAIVEESQRNVLENSVAVLPFANLSPDPDNAFFAAGIHDTVLNELVKISDMHVISRTTMLRYADTEKSMSQIAEELRVETVMEGSVQYANGRVLVTAQLIDPQTDSHLWSENYNREFKDVFAIQADIATRIADALQARISPQERQSIEAKMTDSLEAYAYYLQAMERIGDISPASDTAENHALLDRAIELDPNFANAYALKAHLYVYRSTAEAEVIEYAGKALEIDPDLGLAHSALAKNHKSRMRNEEARLAFAKALALKPNDANTMDDMARFYAQIGDLDTAIRLASRVHDIDPGFSTVYRYVTAMAGDYETSVRAARQSVGFDSGGINRRMQLALAEQRVGNEEAAQMHARIAISLSGSDFEVYDQLPSYISAIVARRYRVLGFNEEARYMFDRFIERAESESPELTAPIFWAQAYIAVDDYEKVMAYLQLAAEQVSSGFRMGGNASLAANFYNNPKLETPEFVAVRKRLGYPALVER